jgi:DNA polymerase-3 subunit delta'
MANVTFEAFKGNDLLKEKLMDSFHAKKENHAYIVEGSLGSGRHQLAKILSAGFLCSSEGNRPCGVCKDCIKVGSGIHPDILEIKLMEKKQSIGIDVIRDNMEDINILPNEAEKKVYLIDSAEKLTVGAQNALLKVLEEPPYFVAFIIIVEAGNNLLPTVLSRCTRIGLNPPEDISSTFVKDYKAYALLSNTFLERLTENSEYDFIKLIDKCAGKSRDHFSEFLGVLYTYLRDILVFKTTRNKEILYFLDRQLQISEFSDKMTNGQVLKLMDFISKTLNALELNCNLNLWAVSFFAKCWEEVH